MDTACVPAAGLDSALLEHSSSSSPCRLSCLRQPVRMLRAPGEGLVRPSLVAELGSERSGSGTGQPGSLGTGDPALGGARAGRPQGCGGLGQRAPTVLPTRPCRCLPLAPQLPLSGLSFQ